MRQRMRNPVLRQSRGKLLGLSRRNWLGPPLVVILRKDLDNIHAELSGGFDGPVVAAGDGHVGAEE